MLAYNSRTGIAAWEIIIKMTTQIYRSDVCIVGDGAVGRTAALGLSRAGLRVILLSEISAAAQPTASADWDVRVFALNHIAHDLLDSLKVWAALDHTRIAAIQGMRVFDAAAPSAFSTNALDFDAYAAYIDQLAWIIEDKNLDQALEAALKFASHITRIHGAAYALQTTANDAQIILKNGDQIHASLVIGADGAQSWVRGQCDIGIDYRSYNQRGVVTNFYCEKPHQGVAHQWFDENAGIIALLPLPDNRVSLVWSAPDALADTLMSENAATIAERLQTYCAACLGQLTPLQPEIVKAFPLRLIKPHAMIAPRVALIGDAAHVVHPLAGHGMNLGFADVTCLLKVINARESHRDCGDTRVLRRFQRARREEVLLMQITTDGLARLFSSHFAPLRFMRNTGLNLFNHLPVLKRNLIRHAMGK